MLNVEWFQKLGEYTKRIFISWDFFWFPVVVLTLFGEPGFEADGTEGKKKK